MICSTCGKENPDQAKFCNSCGTIILNSDNSGFTTQNTSDASETDVADIVDVNKAAYEQSSEYKTPDASANAQNQWVHQSDVKSNPTPVATSATPIATPPVIAAVMAPALATKIAPTVQAYSQNPTEKPNATSMIVFSIINIVCCGNFIFGVIALVFSLMASNDNDYNEARNKLRTAKILNIIGLVISAILFIIVAIIIVFVIIKADAQPFGNQSFTFGTDTFRFGG